jgi:hypothetical protein
MGTKQKVSSIKEKLHKLEKQLEKIQKDCPHNTTSIKFVHQIKRARWVCDDCQHIVRIPNPKEIQRWIDK